MTIKEAKQLDMVEYLAKIGHKPERVQGKSYWYLSPLRTEETPSFKVNKTLNRWYDFAEGKGGNLVDFGILFHQCNISDFLQKLNGHYFSFAQQKVQTKAIIKKEDDSKNHIQVTRVRPITSLPLINYLNNRKIPLKVASEFLKEVTYQLKDKNYYALGFRNDAGGYELRNEYIKAASSPKDTTFIDNGAKELAVFEGFFNFLSHRVLYEKSEVQRPNFLVLNSTSFFEKSIPKMMLHGRVHLYLDMDKTGQSCTQKAINLDRQKFVDERHIYKNHGDLNDILVHKNMVQKQRFQQRP